MSFFDEFLASRVAEEDRAVLNKYPGLRDELTRLETGFADASRRASDWDTWRNSNWIPDASMPEGGLTKAERSLRDQLAAANLRINAGLSADVDVQSLEVKLRKEIEDREKGVRDEMARSFGGMHVFYKTVADRQILHDREFGEPLSSQKLWDFMTANKLNDPEAAYDKMMGPRRAELATQKQKELDTKHTADIEAARKEGYEKRQQEEAMGPHGVMPTDSTGGIAGITASVVQPAKLSDEAVKAASDAKLGTGELARLGYEMFRRGEFHNAA